MPALDPQKSNVKLLVYIPQIDGSDYPLTFYSFLNKNKWSNEKNIADMKRRILNKKLHGFFNIAIFYDNITKKELERIFGEINQKLTFDRNKSKVKMLIYMPDVSAKSDVVYVRYSPIQFNSKSLLQIVDLMKNMLNGLYKNKYRTAVFYENLPNNKGKLLHKQFGNLYENQIS